jgi:ribosomal protein S18 acetylase RimI-like enzyme
MTGRRTTVSRSVIYHAANATEASAIAALHADSWRRHYRGAYSDSFLDGDVHADRLRVWAERLRVPDAGTRTIVAESEDGLVGFGHVVLDDHPRWGALLDNLHVASARRRQGIGAGLMVRLAREVAHARPGSGMFLWVLEKNRPAQAFYESLGGRGAERALVDPPGGDPTRLAGTPAGLRYVWPDLGPLLHEEQEKPAPL